jgi:hypothetical protein
MKLNQVDPSYEWRDDPDKQICGNILFSKDSIYEMDGEKVIVSIPKKDIINILICHGQSVERPLAQIIAAIILCLAGVLIGVMPLLNILVSLIHGEVFRERYGTIMPFAYGSPLIFISLWLLWRVFSKVYYLSVKTNTDERKLVLGNCSPYQVQSTGNSFGYSIKFTSNQER